MPNLATAKAEALEAVRQIDGWLTDAEAAELFDRAAHATAPIIEIGSWQGRSTAALALGSMAGCQQPVYAVDSFDGVPPLDRPSASGLRPGWKSSTPEMLRANLDAAGVNGLVQIIPKPSLAAVGDVPNECGLLFVDGNHDYSAVLADFHAYLPKVRDRGRVVIHDCSESDLGVVKAVDDVLMAQPSAWRSIKRVDSAMVFERRVTQRHNVMLACPGPSMKWCAVQGVLQATLGAHAVMAEQNGNGFDDMNILWVRGLNAAINGEITHFAMLHSDIQPCAGWLDILLAEMDDRDADLVSAVMPLKDTTGCTSCGIGDKDNAWAAFRRFTMRELMEMPETFGIADTPHPDRYLLHNTGCWVADLRKPIWRTVDENNELVAFLNFPLRVRLQEDGSFKHERESEDWFFSRKMAQLGAKTFITRAVQAHHVGDYGYPNSRAWGSFKDGDEATKSKWKPTAESGAD